MNVFDVTINNAERRVIGIPGDGVITASISYVRRIHKKVETKPGLPPEELEINLGGLQTDNQGGMEHLKWLKKSLKIGDEIVIRIRNSEKCDSPFSRSKDAPKDKIDRKKRQLEALKKELGEI